MKALILNTLLATAIYVPAAGFADQPTLSAGGEKSHGCNLEAVRRYISEVQRQDIRAELFRNMQEQLRAVQAQVATDRLTAAVQGNTTSDDQI